MTADRRMTASNWRLVNSNTLRGFFTLTLASGLVIHQCSLHAKGDRRWVLFPAAPQIDGDTGRQRIDPATGKKLYTPIIQIPNRARRDAFTEAALAAVDTLLAELARPGGKS